MNNSGLTSSSKRIVHAESVLVDDGLGSRQYRSMCGAKPCTGRLGFIERYKRQDSRGVTQYVAPSRETVRQVLGQKLDNFEVSIPYQINQFPALDGETALEVVAIVNPRGFSPVFDHNGDPIANRFALIRPRRKSARGTYEQPKVAPVDLRTLHQSRPGAFDGPVWEETQRRLAGEVPRVPAEVQCPRCGAINAVSDPFDSAAASAIE